MAVYENNTRELFLKQYKEYGTFTGDEIINNDLSDITCPDIRFINTAIKGSSLDRTGFLRMKCDNVLIEQVNFNSIRAGDSDMQRCMIKHCHSIKADFSGSQLNKVQFENCTAHSIKFSRVRIVSSLFTECQMYKARFDNSVLINVDFRPGEKGDLSTLQKSTFANSMVIDCSFSHINLMGAVFTNTVFIGCDFTQSILDDADLLHASFIHCMIDTHSKTGHVWPVS